MNKKWHDFRGYAGRIESGVFKPGDEVVLLPSGFETRIKSIQTMDGELNEAFSPMSVVMTLEDEVDLSRGDMIAKKNNRPKISQDIDLMLCWLCDTPFNPAKKYKVLHTTNEARAMIKDIQYKIDINTLHRTSNNIDIALNDIARVKIRTNRSLLHDSYNRNRKTGSLILVDEFDFQTVAAGLIL